MRPTAIRLLAYAVLVLWSNTCLALEPVEGTFELRFDITPEAVSSLTATVWVPRSVPDRQKVRILTITPKPKKKETQGQIDYAHFDLKAPLPKAIVIQGIATIQHYDLETIMSGVKPRRQDPASRYLSREEFIDSDHPDIRRVAGELKGESESETLSNIYEFVTKHLKYTGYQREEKGAVEAWRTGTGDCSEFSDLMVALCRANRIPARVVGGFTINTTTMGHARVEVYLKRLGWIPFDPSSRRATFEKLAPGFLQMSTERIDTILDGGSYYKYYYYGKKCDFVMRFLWTKK